MPRLDDRQESAVKTTAKRVLVSAVPGSGKTSTLVARLRYMVEELKLDPSGIVAITFTRMAAKEIRDRLGDAGRGMYIGTLHAFALRLIMEMGGSVGYEPSWLSILDETDTELDCREVLADLGIIRKKLGGGYDWRRVRAKDWEDFLEKVQSGDAPDREGSKAPETLWKAYDAMLARFRAQNVLTFGSILTEAHRLLHDPKALKSFRARYRHFLVDESQDTNSIQWHIVWRFVERADPDTLFAVGDSDQSIYAFRGARPDIMVQMATDPAYEVHALEYCYRFGPSIGEAAQRLIEHNQTRIPTKIIAKGGPSDPVEYIEGLDAAGIAYKIRKQVETQRPGEIAVLARTHRVLVQLAEELKSRGVPHVKVGRTGELKKTAEFRALMGYLRLACNPHDRRAFMAITATEGLKESDILRLREESVRTSRPLVECYGHVLPDTVDKLQSHVAVMDPHTDYSEPLNWLIRVAFYEGLSTPRSIVEYVSMSDVQDEIMDAKDRDAVVLATCHAAKGLEWPVVFIVGANEGIFPSGRSVREGGIEEERRLFYVAMTRTRTTLKIFKLEDWRNPDASRFVGEAVGTSGEPT